MTTVILPKHGTFIGIVSSYYHHIARTPVNALSFVEEIPFVFFFKTDWMYMHMLEESLHYKV